jgi:hypothetical protein
MTFDSEIREIARPREGESTREVVERIRAEADEAKQLRANEIEVRRILGARPGESILDAALRAARGSAGVG